MKREMLIQQLEEALAKWRIRLRQIQRSILSFTHAGSFNPNHDRLRSTP